MRRLHVKPLAVDRQIAGAIAQHTTPRLEQASRVLTWVADEHVVYLLSAALWLISQRNGRGSRAQANHILACAVAANVLPHLLKSVISQERPDRCMVHGRRRGIPRSGRALDAFPSGHAMHIGALASAAGWIYPEWRRLVWMVGGLLATTRVVLLAHWASDVAVGLGVGILTEHLLRLVPGVQSSPVTISAARSTHSE